MISSYRADHLEASYAGGLNHEPGEDTIAFGKHAAALQIEGRDDVLVLAAGTDGSDGNSSDSGALVDGMVGEAGGKNPPTKAPPPKTGA